MSINCYPPQRPRNKVAMVTFNPPRRTNNKGAMILAGVLGILLTIAMYGWYIAESNAEDMRRELNNEIYILKAKESTTEAVQA